MVYERILKTFDDTSRKSFQLVFRKRKCLHQFLIHHLTDIFPYHRILTSITHNVNAGKISYRRKNGVRTVQQSHFPFVIRLFRRNEQYIQSCLAGRKLIFHTLRSLDNPQMKGFSLHDKVVIVTQMFLYAVNRLSWETRNDTVYQRSIYSTSHFKP